MFFDLLKIQFYPTIYRFHAKLGKLTKFQIAFENYLNPNEIL